MNVKHVGMLVVGLVLSILVINMFGLEETLAELSGANYFIIFLAAIAQALVLGTIVIRIKVIARGRGYLSYPQAIRMTLTGMFVSMLTPLAKLGGEPLKMFMLRKSIGGQSASASIAVESLMEVLSSVVVVVLVMMIYFEMIPAAYISSFLIFLFAICIGLALLFKILFTPRWLNKVMNWLANRLAGLMEVKKKDYTEIFANSFYELFGDRKRMLSALALSVLSKVFEMARFWLIFIALGEYLPFHTIVLVWTILLIILFIPWLPGSLGLAELGGISALVAFGVHPEVAASAIILDRLLSFWLPLGAGFIALSWAKRKDELPDLKWKKQHTTSMDSPVPTQDPVEK